MSDQKLNLERIFGDPDINGDAPISLKFSADGRYVSFLKSNANNVEQLDLWVFDIALGQSRLLVDASDLTDTKRVLSDEEKARRERLRVSQSGIVEYYWSPTGDKLVFPLNGDLFLYELDSSEPVYKLTDETTFETDITFSPDGRYLGFVRQQNIHVINLSDKTSRQLTSDGGGVISNGLAEFIAQEEMHRFRGYWWSPDSVSIAFTRVDESPIEISQRYEIDADSFGVYDQRYPFAGTANADVTVGVVNLATMNTCFANLPGDSEDYICRVSWLRDNQSLAIQTQSRNQQTLALLVWNSSTTQLNHLLTEQSTTWLNLHDIFYPLSNGKEFIWASERSGYQHLYHYNFEGTLLNTLTSGPWVVTNLCRVSEDSVAGAHVYFEGFMDTPLEKHLYCISLNTGSMPTRITQPGFFHSVTFSSNHPYFIDHFSSADKPPAVALRSLDGETISDLAVNELDAGHPYHPYRASRGIVSFGELKAEDGQTLHYRLMKPAHLQANEKCPVIVTVYGGPGVQRVTNEWIPAWHHYMTQQGYALLQLDNRGTANRGKQFEDPIHLHMGQIEVADQLVGVDYLKRLPFIDANRIGVFGHSYGGYMTLMMMMKSDQFSAGVSVAPVTDWGLYDTHYTERFLGHPRDNADGYEQSNVFPFVKGLKGKLLMIHGMADDNVLLSHSTKLYKLLQDENIDFEIMNYPGAKHGLTGRKTNIHRYGMMDRFFARNL